ncbi:hypothetical protein Tco_0500323 [Tanacetum coccineum]
MRAPLRARFKDLPTSDMKEILLQRMLEENYDKGHAEHRVAYEALQGSIHRDECEDFYNDKAQKETKKKGKQDSPKPPPGSPPSPPPPPPPSGASGASGTTRASDSVQAPPPPPSSSSTPQGNQSTGTATLSSSKTAASAEYSTPSTPEPAWTIPSSDLSMPTNNWAFALKSTYAPPQENSLLAQTRDMATFMDCANKLLTYSDDQSSGTTSAKHFPLGGLATALSISKMKAAYYPDVGLEQLVPDQFWIAEECKYDIAAMTHMRILSVVRIEVFSMYGYNYMKKIVLRRADLKEYTIAERDFKHLYPSDFEDLYLLNLQGHLNHLSPEDKKILTTAVNLWTRNLVIRHRVEDFQLGIESYQTQLNLTKPRWEATGFEFKHDYTVIDSPRAVTFRDRYGVQMIMRFNEIHKFSDGTLQQIDEALDYRVKEFQINRTNPGMNTRFWTKKDVDRSKEFMFAIQKRLKTRRIFRNLESFVGGRIREGDYRYMFPRSRQSRRDLPRDNPLVSVEVLRCSDTYTGNPVKEILLKMNLPDHRIKQKWRWNHPVPVESIHHPMLTLNASKLRHHDN